GISFADFKSNVGLFKTPGGIFWLNPNLLDITRNAAGYVTTSKIKAGLLAAPTPGTFGNFPVNSLSGHRYVNYDVSLTKRLPITERVRLEMKAKFLNILNHPNFIIPTQNVDSTTFGMITSQRGIAR